MFDPLPTDISNEDPSYENQQSYQIPSEQDATMASPPHTPVHRRRSSNFSSSSLRHSQSLSQRSSQAYSPAHSRLGSSQGGGSLAQEFEEMGGGGGLGSLADELGGWSGEEEEEDDEGDGDENGARRGEQERDSGIDVACSPPPGGGKMSSPATTSRKSSHKRGSSAYDGSEYGSESDFEQTELVSATLEARLSVVEALARRGIEENGSEGDRVIARVTDALNDLGGQSGIETGATRLTTAYTALSTHLNHQTRLLAQLTSTILSPLAPSLPEELIESLLPDIDATLLLIPHITPSPQPPYALHSLVTHTSDLIQALNYLSDTLHVNRQTTTVAGRRLRAVKEALREWRLEMGSRDESVRWIEHGCWDQRLKKRECASVCDEVLGGFEDVCGSWRERLSAGLETQSVAAG